MLARTEVRLICWNEAVASERAAALEAAGFAVDGSRLNTSRFIGQFRDSPPAAIAIDLDRLPSHGLAVGVALRRSPSTRHIPVVFVGGEEEKIARVREQLPDAAFSPWKGAAAAIRKAVKNPPPQAIRPPSPMGAYAEVALLRKLGLKPDMKCALIGAPEGFEERLDGLPDTVEFQRRITPECALAIWFVRSRAEMEAALELASVRLPDRVSIWMIYPKRAGREFADFTLTDVRAAAQEVGMSDSKICAVDADWAGLKFGRRKQRSR